MGVEREGCSEKNGILVGMGCGGGGSRSPSPPLPPAPEKKGNMRDGGGWWGSMIHVFMFPLFVFSFFSIFLNFLGVFFKKKNWCI